MVTDRQKRNWAKKQFERLDDTGKILETVKEPDEIEIVIPQSKNNLEEPFIPYEDDGISEPENTGMLVRQNQSEFIPSKRQLQAKLRFHKYAPTAVILNLFDTEPANTFCIRGSDVRIVDYVGQISEDEFDNWLDIPGFWPWFIADDAVDADLYHAKKAATDYLLALMELPDRKPDGELDMSVIRLKMGVARDILNQNKTVKIEKKTLNVNTIVNNLPKHFKKMDTNRIEQRIRQLKEHQE